jgi:hypothetical protein
MTVTAGHSYNGHHSPCNNHSNVERTSAPTLGAELINHPDRRSFSTPGLGSTWTVCRLHVQLDYDPSPARS